MTKKIYKLATDIQEQLLGTALLHPPDQWVQHVPRVQLDAWATLQRWNECGQIISRITQEQAEAILSRELPPQLPLATARAQHEAIACQLPDRRSWIILARHSAGAFIQVHGQHGWAYSQPLLTYCTSSLYGSADGFGSGFFNLLDQPAPEQMAIHSAMLTDAETERQSPIVGDLTEDITRIRLALSIFYRAS